MLQSELRAVDKGPAGALGWALPPVHGAGVERKAVPSGPQELGWWG